MASLEELNNQFQTLQQTIQQQQEKINALEKKAIENQQDILLVENHLASTQQELEQTKRELQESKLHQHNNLETQIQKFNTLIDNLKGPNGETLKFACGSTPPGNTLWRHYENAPGSIHPRIIYTKIDTSNAGFSSTPYYFTNIKGKGYQLYAQGVNAIAFPTNKSFEIYVSYGDSIVPEFAHKYEWYIEWFAVGV